NDIRRVGQPGRVSAEQSGHACGRARHGVRGPGLRRATNHLSLTGRTAFSVIKRRADPTDLVLSTLLYVSPVQMIPACDHTGTPDIEFDGFFHFNSSTTSGSACLMSIRIRASVSLRQSLSSLILASIS